MKQHSTPMNNILKSLIFSLKCLILVLAFSFNANSQTTRTFISGSYIVNMGVHSGTRATDISKELKAWGFVYDMLKNYNVPVYVVINPTKAKDSADFTYNGVKYKGGTFIIDKKNISSVVAARITYWIGLGMQGAYTNSNLTVNTTFKYTVAPRWTLDKDKGSIAMPFFTNAGIPTSAYDTISPFRLGACNDIFVMPHADPTWAVHGNLYNWNLTYKGAIWTGCHAGSALSNTYNPNDTSQQMNFLTTKTNQSIPPIVYSYSSTGATSGSTNATKTTVTVNSTAGLQVGMVVVVTSGTGAFAANTTVSSINSTTSFTVSANPTTRLVNATISGTLSVSVSVTLPQSGSTSFSENSLILWGNHSTATPPYSTSVTGNNPTANYANPSDPVAQYMGVTDLAHQNGSEQSYLPVKSQKWLPSTKIICYNDTTSNASDGPEVLIAYGRAFGNSDRGLVMLEAGHDLDKGTAGDVAAQRAFWNWSFLAAQDKAVIINSINGLPANGVVTGPPNTYNLSVSYTATTANTGLTFTWSCIKSSDGTSFGSFSPNGTTASNNTVFTPGSVTVPTDVVITIVITDACGRKSFESIPVTIVPLTVAISGTVWNDGNISANNTFNNIYTNGESGSSAGNTLYVYCVDQNGLVIAIDTVNADGTYSFSNLAPNANLSLVLSTLPGQVGSLPPTATIGTAGWNNSTPLIRTGITTGTTNIASLDFGIYSLPNAVNNQYATDTNVPVTSSVATNDFPSANPNNTWAVTNNPTHGSVVLNSDGSFTYTPNNNYAGNDTFFYSICDQYHCDTARVIIYITASAPVTLSTFTARVFDSKQSVINFTTEMEVNTNHFEIERSTDAINFVKRGNVTAVGNSNIRSNYQYFDGIGNTSNVIYYRLRMVDNDGSFKLSNIISLKLKGLNNNGMLNVYPNPFTTDIKVECLSQINEPATVSLYSIDGRIVQQQKTELIIGNNIILMNNLSSLQKGSYLIEVKTGSGKVIKKIVKN